MRRLGRLAALGATIVLWGIPSAPVAHATFPGQNGRIAFGSNQTGTFQIYTMRANGTHMRQLTNFPNGIFVSAWSPDGRSIAFHGYREGHIEIYVMRADGSDVHQVTHLNGFSEDPSWSPDGGRLVFEHIPQDGCCLNIFSIRPNGTDLKRLTHFTTQTFAGEPEYSPDGGWIAFQQFPRGGPRSAVYLMRFDGTERHRVTPLRLDAGHAGWSPDGSVVIFNDHLTLPVGDLFTIHPDGSSLTRLTNVAHRGEAYYRPDYSPDGKRIVFGHFIPDEPEEVLMMNADGTGIRLLNSANSVAPDWGPRA